MTKWDYLLIDSNDVKKGLGLSDPGRDEIEKYLSDLGLKGWEIVNLDFYDRVFRGGFTGVAKRERS
ncbi:MAG: hypothetical protein ACE5M4_03125 [Anaerolineales bacterium]